MNLKRKLLNIFFINLILPISLFSQFAFFSFEDNSNYKGSWNLSYDIPDFISDFIREKYSLRVLSPIVVENLFKESAHQNLYELLLSQDIQFLVRGTIKDFSINRLIAGEPKIAQYETYSNNISVQFEIMDLKSNKVILSETIEQKSSDLGVEVTIYGQETEVKKEFSNLDRIKFGSDEFLRTLVGKNLIKFCEKFTSKLETVPEIALRNKTFDSKSDKTKSKFKTKVIEGEILFIDEETKEVFINLGRRENLQTGMVLSVYAPKDTLIDEKTGEFLGIAEKKIGEIEIIEVRGDRFSLGLIKEEKERIVKGNKVKKVEISPE